MAQRLVRALFVGFAVSISWGIRGDFGGVIGAMYPGAALGLAFAFVTGQRSMFRWTPLLAAASALSIGIGGEMSYGVLHGYAKADTFVNYAYGYFTLFCQGASWGIFGCAVMGLMLERKPLRIVEWASAAAAVYLGAFLLYWLVIYVIGFDVNPPRSNRSVAHFGGAIALLIWLWANNRRTGLRGAVFGFFAFGIGMFAGRLLEMAYFQLPFKVPSWNLNEVFVGFVGAFAFAFGMLGYDYPEPPEEDRKSFGFLSLCGILLVMVGIPFQHRVRLLRPESRLEGWAKAFEGYGYDAPEAWADFIVTLLNVVCAFAVVGAVLWVIIHHKRLWKFRAFPIFYFTFLMMMYQKFHSHYFWYTRNVWGPNMHDIYWGMFALMVVMAFFCRKPYPTRTDEEMARLPWVRWIAITSTVFILVLAAAGFWVNKDGKTMGAANTRFPLWSWRDGPFPGRE